MGETKRLTGPKAAMYGIDHSVHLVQLLMELDDLCVVDLMALKNFLMTVQKQMREEAS